MTSKHTPGPWYVGFASLCVYAGEDNSPEPQPYIVREVAGANREANARLIAAAPDLLESLLEVEKFFVSDPNLRRDGWMADTLRTIRVAIAKARGEG